MSEQPNELVAFLSDPDTYPHRPSQVEVIETHMSRVFVAGDLVYKMKKPVRLDFVDFTTLEARRQNSERELELNQRLAPGVYLQVVPVARGTDSRLSLGGTGEPLEWLLVMRWLDPSRQLGRALVEGRASRADIDLLCDTLGNFYRETARIGLAPNELLDWWQQAVAWNENTLTDPSFDLPRGQVQKVLDAQRRFLDSHGDLIAARAEATWIVDAHGDLRPEHVHLGPPLRLIDRLEFNESLRQLDPFDEAAFLGLECKRLGGAWVGSQLIDGLAKRLGDRPPDLLLNFYAGYRAAMRARLSIEHLRDPNPRTPERWPRQAREYLDLAVEAFGSQS